MEKKEWYKSNTVWSGILKLLAGILITLASFLSSEIDIQTVMTGCISSIWGIYDIIIRFRTTKTLTVSY